MLINRIIKLKKAVYGRPNHIINGKKEKDIIINEFKGKWYKNEHNIK